MRKKVLAWVVPAALSALSYLVPKCLEIFGVITQESYWLPYSILALVLIILGTLVWQYWPEIKQARKGVHHKMVNIGLVIGAVGIGCLIAGMVLVVPRLSVNTKDTRIPLQVQLDTLINDLITYKKTIQPFPTQNPDESWDDYTQRLVAYYDNLNADLVQKFNARIIDTLNKLHDFRIISDTEFQEDQRFVSSVATYTCIYVGGLLDKLCNYKTGLDSFVENLGINKFNSR